MRSLETGVKKMTGLTHDEAVILGLLSLFKQPVLRTKLVKLTYLLDNLRFENLGEQATEFRYVWDYYGPNAIGNAITDTLSSLAARELIVMTERMTPYENYAYYYRASNAVDRSALPLTDDDWVFIRAAFDRYGHLARSAVVTASKETEPMKDARQFEVLEFKQSADAGDLKGRFFADRQFVDETKRAASSPGERIRWEDLRAKLGQSTNV